MENTLQYKSREFVCQISNYRSEKYSVRNLRGIPHEVKSSVIIFKGSPSPVCVTWGYSKIGDLKTYGY